MERICGVYSIKNIKTGKMYIGSSVNALERWENHKRSLRRGKHHSRPLQRAWDKYGEKSFLFELLITCPQQRLLTLEQVYMLRYKSAAPTGYNASKLAKGVVSAQKPKISGIELSAILSEKANVQWADPIIKEKMLRRMKEAGKLRRGVPHKLVTRIKLSVAIKNRSPKVIEKQAAAMRAKWADPAYREKMNKTYDKRRKEKRDGVAAVFR